MALRCWLTRSSTTFFKVIKIPGKKVVKLFILLEQKYTEKLALKKL